MDGAALSVTYDNGRLQQIVTRGDGIDEHTYKYWLTGRLFSLQKSRDAVCVINSSSQ